MSGELVVILDGRETARLAGPTGEDYPLHTMRRGVPPPPTRCRSRCRLALAEHSNAKIYPFLWGLCATRMVVDPLGARQVPHRNG